MIVHMPRLLLTMAAMLVIALVLDVIRPRVIQDPGEQTLRRSDRLLVNLLFFVLTPAVLYAWFYPLVPFSGYRAGLFLGWSFFLLAVAPSFAVYRLQVPDRTSSLLGHLFWLLLKYLLVYSVLTELYQP
jgi:hypothetical protein